MEVLTMKIMMYGLYGGTPNTECYYRRLGHCFDFVNVFDLGTELTVEEAREFLEHGDWYLKQYNADGMKMVMGPEKIDYEAEV